MSIPLGGASRRSCSACGSIALSPWLQGLQDYLFGVPGRWDMARCSDCGTLSLDPMPTADQIAGFYKNYFTHVSIGPVTQGSTGTRLRRTFASTLRSPFEHQGAAARVARTLVRCVLPRAGQTLHRSYAFLGADAAGLQALDFGCGNGELVRRLSALGIHARGTDFDSKALATCRAAGLDVMPIEECNQLPSGSVDLATCMNVIEHVPHPEGVLRLLRRLLRPRGRLLLETPNATSWMALAMGDRWRGLEVPRHLNIFSPAGLSSLLVRSGFSVVDSRFVPAAGFMASTSNLSAMTRRAWRLASPFIDLGEYMVPARREVIFVEARPAL
jgi:SAM-dependent methyltransferase